MTCIVGLVDDGRVWIGGDNAGVDSAGNMTRRAAAKVFRNGPFLIGFTSSFRMGDLLRYSLEVPKRPKGMGVRRFMVTRFIVAVRRCLKDCGYQQVQDAREYGGEFLVGYSGRLFKVCPDYQVGELVGFGAIGCGLAFACGAMYASQRRPRDRVRVALQAAERFSSGVRGPFVIKSIGEKQ